MNDRMPTRVWSIGCWLPRVTASVGDGIGSRFADTKGYTYGGEAQRWMHAPVYRDWVIRSFNDDMPYDRFLILQLAADQLASTPHDESLAAMGFLTIGRRFLGVEADIIDDRIDVMTRGMLGLTVACARCHDHKFDPISTKDYYALYGVFQASYEQRVRLGPHDDSSPEPTAFDVELKKRLDKWNTEFTTRRDLLEDATRRLTPEYWVAALDVGKSLPADFDQILGVDDKLQSARNGVFWVNLKEMILTTRSPAAGMITF